MKERLLCGDQANGRKVEKHGIASPPTAWDLTGTRAIREHINGVNCLANIARGGTGLSGCHERACDAAGLPPDD